MYKSKEIDIESISNLIEYNPDNGFLYWKKRDENDGHAAISFNKRRAGNKIESKPFDNGHGNKYKRVKVLGQSYLYHRLCWALYKNEQPLYIDHINGDGTDNRIKNLRSVDPTENNRNMRMNKLNKSGYMGVNKYAGSGDRWVSYIWINNKQISLGVFDTKIEAIAARKAAEKVENYHKNHGRKLSINDN